MGVFGRKKNKGKNNNDNGDELPPPIIKSPSVENRLKSPRRVSLKEVIMNNSSQAGTRPDMGRKQLSAKSSLSSHVTRESMKQRMSIATLNLHGLIKDDLDDDSSVASEVIPSDAFTKTMGVSRQNSTLLMDVASSSIVNADVVDPYNVPFESQYEPSEMRCLALVAHNHMKPAMKEFVMSHKEVLKKFRLTGTNTTITLLKSIFGDDPEVCYGPSFQSGPLGGDAELCALACLEDLGGCFFFMDPLSAHPHQADIDCLVRLLNVHNILTCINPCTAHAMSFVLKSALEDGRLDQIPSFFYTLKSPGVAVYKAEQKQALEAAKQS
uniref:MGS-like domain-containing protein n=1 Tax=Ditylum brightwellii TaxID=49249 RepID=A0A7S4W720_9STRA